MLIDSQGFIDGIGPMASLPRPLAKLGVEVLRSVPLRQLANNMAYYNNDFASDDAMKVGRLHTFLPGSLKFRRLSLFSLSRVTHLMTCTCYLADVSGVLNTGPVSTMSDPDSGNSMAVHH